MPPIRDVFTRRNLRLALLVVVSIVVLGFALVVASLDKEIRTKFAGVRWSLPAQVYAAPLELYAGLPLSQRALIEELDRLGYREVGTLDGPGTFSRAGGLVQIYSREFQFFDGKQTAQKIAVAGSVAIDEVRDVDSGQALEIVRLDPMLVGSIYPQRGGEDRQLIRLQEAPKLLRDGLLAVEDRGFYSHFGVSIRGIARATLENITNGKVRQGASTITQQLVKNFFLTSERTLRRKFKEIIMAVLLEVHYSKDEILEAYMNEIFMGQDGDRAVHGFALAAKFYFNKPLGELRPHEEALLVAAVKGPSVFNPRRNPTEARKRRNLVLRMWQERGLIDERTALAAIAQPLGTAGGKRSGVERYPAFVDLVKRQLKSQYAEAALTDEGLRIFTTLNPRVQDSLETRLATDVPQLERSRRMSEDSLQGAGIVTSIEGGEVLALVGGRDPRFQGFNRALDSRRPIGSLSKPFVFLTALAKPGQFNLMTPILDDYITVRQAGSKPWQPKNYDHRLHGSPPLYLALAQSYNLPTVRIGQAVGLGAVVRTFEKAGIQEVPEFPSLYLGAAPLSLLDLAQGYNTIAALGYRSPLSGIQAVTSKDGVPLRRYPLKLKQSLDEGPAWLTTWAMRQVIDRGTARAAYSYLAPGQRLAGKTGTTDDARDSWFAGYGSDRLAVIWVGRDDNKPTGLTGATGAMPVWARLMRDINARSLDDSPPEGVNMVDGCGMVYPVIAGYGAEQQCAPSDEVLLDGEDPDAEPDAAAVEAILNGQTPPPAEQKPDGWLEEMFQ